MIQHSHAAKKPARVVITGGSGFIGKNIAAELQRRGVEALPLSSAQLDLCAAGASAALSGLLRKDDALVIASAVTPDKGRDARSQMKNFTMGLALGDALEKTPCAHVIYLSSDAVYDDRVSLVNEATLPSPGSFYGIAHFGRERLITDALKKSGTPFLILRPSIIYGAGDTHNSYGPNRFFRAAAAGKISLFGGGQEKRDHVCIEDVCRLMAECLFRQSRGILNVATGRSVPFFEVADKIQKLFGGKVQVEPGPRSNPVTHRHYDITACLQAFPDFSYTRLDQGLADTFKKIQTQSQ